MCFFHMEVKFFFLVPTAIRIVIYHWFIYLYISLDIFKSLLWNNMTRPCGIAKQYLSNKLDLKKITLTLQPMV